VKKDDFVLATGTPFFFAVIVHMTVAEVGINNAAASKWLANAEEFNVCEDAQTYVLVLSGVSKSTT